MMMRILKIFLFLFLLSAQVDDVNSAIFQLEPDDFSSRAHNTRIYSYDFNVNVIEHDGILIDAVSVTPRNTQRPFVPFDNGGHLLFISRNVFLNVTKGMIAMNLPTAKGGLIRLIAGAGSDIEFEPDSFTIISAVSNPNAVKAILEGIEFIILPGETTRFIETNIIPPSVNVAFNQNTGGPIFWPQRRRAPVMCLDRGLLPGPRSKARRGRSACSYARAMPPNRCGDCLVGPGSPMTPPVVAFWGYRCDTTCLHFQ